MLIALLVIVAIMVLAVAVGVPLMLARRNRVVRGVPSPAPVSWLSSTRREAMLHRKLRAAGRRLELLPAADDVIDVVARLRVELVELDAHLVTVSRRPSKARRADRKEIAAQVTEVEDLIRRVEERNRNDTGSLDDVAERLDMLEAADDELRGLEPG